jgi:hypothetical protein
VVAGQETPALQQQELRSATACDMRREGAPACTSSLSDASKDDCQLASLIERGGDDFPASIRQEVAVAAAHDAKHHSAD